MSAAKIYSEFSLILFIIDLQKLNFLSRGNVCVRAQLPSHIQLCDFMDVGHQTLPSMEFPRQEYWSGLPFPPPGDLPYPGTELASPVSPCIGREIFTTGPPEKPSDECIDQ